MLFQLLLNGLIAGSLLSLIAGGLSLGYGLLGVFNFALGQIAVFSGYIAWWLWYALGLPLTLSIAGGLIAGGFLGMITFEIFVSPFFKQHKLLPFVTTIAWSTMLDGAMILLFGEHPRRILSEVEGSITILGGQIRHEQIILIFLTLLVLCLLAGILHTHHLGRRLRAVAENVNAALSLGIPTSILYRLVFCGSGVLLAAGGIFLALDQNLTTTVSFSLTIKAYAAGIAGGRGNLWGTIVCAYAIALLEQFVVGIHWFGLSLSAGYQTMVALIVIIVILFWRPSGLFVSSRRIA